MNDNQNTEDKPSETTIIDERTIRNKIYEVRGVKVMLDYDLAEIYGYTTSAFNQQVKRNVDRFDEDFRFQLTREETEILSISQFVISIQTKGLKGGRAKLPWAFTESGVYMLMTVLKGDLAVQQSKALIRIFREMKEYIIDTQGLITQRDLLRVSIQTTENTEAIRSIHSMIEDQQKLLLEHDDKLVNAFERINETVKQSDLSPVMMKFNAEEESKEYLLREGCPVKADVTYIDIYSKATKSIFIIDNYINIKTLRLLQDVKSGVKVTVFSDNLYKHLHYCDYVDFQTEFPSIPITFITTGGIMHDRFIILDYACLDERIFHCGASSKDAAVKLTTAISEMMSEDLKIQIHNLIDQMKKNPPLILPDELNRHRC